MMGDKFTRVVEECLHRLDRGENLPEILVDYPHYAERLKPLLLVAMASRAIDLPAPDQGARRRGRNQMLAEMDQMASGDYFHGHLGFTRLQGWYYELVNQSRSRGLILRPVPSYRLAVVALVMVFSIGLFTISASASGPSVSMLKALAADIRQVLGVSVPEQPLQGKAFEQIYFFNDGDLHLGNNRGAKVAFLLDLEEDQTASGNQTTSQNQQRGGDSGQGWEGNQAEVDPEIQPPDNPGNGMIPPGLVDNPGRDIAPGQQDGQGTEIAPGQQDGQGRETAPGQQDKEKKDKSNNKDKDKDVGGGPGGLE